ncbi:MAG: tetratricopeptide repeat protein [Candidatus Omnitrophica bacterium]|nr:tetratricopeptide repeat protein [Candidatus Omnitrophota bacterium]
MAILPVIIVSVLAFSASIGLLAVYLVMEDRQKREKKFELKKVLINSEITAKNQQIEIERLQGLLADQAKENELRYDGQMRELKAEVAESRLVNEKIMTRNRILEEELAMTKRLGDQLNEEFKRFRDKIAVRQELPEEPVSRTIVRDYQADPGGIRRPKGNAGSVGIFVVLILMIVSVSGVIYGLVTLYSDLKAKDRQLNEAMEQVRLKPTEDAQTQELITNLRVSLDNSLKNNSELSGKVKELSDSLDTLKKTITDRNTQINFLTSERARMEKSLNDQIAADTTRLSALVAEKGTLESTFKAEQEKAAQAQEGMRSDIAKLKVSLQALEAEKAALERNVQKLSHDALVIETEKMHFNLANHFLESRQYDNAIKEYERALALRPDDVDAHYNVALIYDIYTDDNKNAVLHYERVLELNPDFNKRKDIEERIAFLDMRESASIAPTVAVHEKNHTYNPDTIQLKDE